MPTRALVTRYEQDLERFPDSWQRFGMALLLVAVLSFPVLASSYWMTVMNQALISIVGAVGLMILTGFAGQISLGHAAFLAVGAYSTAVMGKHFHVPFWVAIPVSGLLATFVGLLVGPFALRLRGLYLAIVTLGLLFLVDHCLLSLPEWTGGVGGTAVPMYSGLVPAAEAGTMGDLIKTTELGPLKLDFDRKLYLLNLAIAAASVLLCSNIRRSRLGRSMMAVRDSDLAAMAIGVRPAQAKIAAFGLSSFLGGVAGSLFAFQQQYITVVPPFDLNMSIQYIAMIVLGGVGSTFGAVAGALFFVAFAPMTEHFGSMIPLIKELSTAQQSTLLFSVLVCLVLVFEPLGIYGIWLRIKRYFLAWPFRY